MPCGGGCGGSKRRRDASGVVVASTVASPQYEVVNPAADGGIELVWSMYEAKVLAKRYGTTWSRL